MTGLAALALVSAALAADKPRLQALVWIAPGYEAEALTRQPAICREPATNESQFAAGQALFYAPFLLGGQAARAGVSCASCHSNGRRNAHFFLAGVSSAPGTADVSASFFSPVRANHRFDPKSIPDLALPGKVSRDPASGELEQFLRGLIVEEFAGREPGRTALAALAAYVRAVGPCPGDGTAPIELADQLGLVRDSVQGAASMAERGEGEAAAVLVSGARHQLGLIHERYAGRGLDSERRLLVSASRALQQFAGEPDPDVLKRWFADFERRIVPRLERTEVRSLYNPALLARWLAD